MNRRAAFERTDVKSIDSFGVEKPQFEIVSRSAEVLRQRSEIQVAALLTTFNSEVNRVAMYAVQRGLVEVQADRTGLPLSTVELPCPCSNLDCFCSFFSSHRRYPQSPSCSVKWACFHQLTTTSASDRLDPNRNRKDCRICCKTQTPTWIRDVRRKLS